jgi:hypothetical protein
MAALRKAVGIISVLGLTALLPGCAVIGPLLSVGGMVGLAPLQYASTAYTVGEFTYEYAANDKDPGEVIQAKIDGVLSGEAFTLPDAVTGYDAPDAGNAVVVADADGVADEPAALSVQGREKRIEQLLGRRSTQFERLELRRMAFLKARSDGQLSLRQTAMVSSPDLFQGAVGETRLR